MRTAGALISFLLGGSQVAVTGPGVGDAAAVRFVDRIVAETTVAWTAAFRDRGLAYAPPRVLYLRLPAGHPGRGVGLSGRFGLVIDLVDLQGLDRVLGADGPPMTALIVAHEVGHHVQNLRAAAGDAQALAPGAAREGQADCYAGWWLGRSRYGDALRQDDPSGSDLTVKLSRTLQVLDLLERGGVDFRRNSEATHGRLRDRVEAIRRGEGFSEPWTC